MKRQLESNEHFDKAIRLANFYKNTKIIEDIKKIKEKHI